METIKIDWANSKYVASWNGFSYKANAETVANEISSIGEEFTAQQVVDYAEKHPDSELYKCFSWDDEKCANLYRCGIARQIIGNLKITIIHDEPEIAPKPTNIRFFSMPEHSHGTYKKTEIVVKRPDEYQILLETALNELRWFRNKYANLSELEAVFEAIDAL